MIDSERGAYGHQSVESADPPQYDRQTYFAGLPVFPAYQLHEASRETLHNYQKLVSREHREPGTRTNISQMEMIYPWLLQKEGIIDGLEEQKPDDNNRNYEKATLYGTKLHEADVLFSIIAQRGSGKPYLPIEQILPTEKNEQKLAAYENAAFESGVGEIKDGFDLETSLMRAWTQYHLLTEPDDVTILQPEIILSDKTYAQPLPGFGIPDPAERRKLWTGDELLEIGVKLAKAWARESFNEEPMAWKFRLDTLSQMEIMISSNYQGARLSFNSRVDDLTRMLSTNKKHVEAQTLDLKTGTKREYQGIEAEIKKRQKQVTYINSERFVVKYMRGKQGEPIRSLKPPEKGSFFMGIDLDSSKLSRRLNLAGNLWFNQGTGEFELERFTMTPEEREEFFVWIVWYGNLINYHKTEIQKLKKRKPRWNLRNVHSLSDEFVIPDHQALGFV